MSGKEMVRTSKNELDEEMNIVEEVITSMSEHPHKQFNELRRQRIADAYTKILQHRSNPYHGKMLLQDVRLLETYRNHSQRTPPHSFYSSTHALLCRLLYSLLYSLYIVFERGLKLCKSTLEFLAPE